MSITCQQSDDKKSFDPLFSVPSGTKENRVIEIFLIINYNQLARWRIEGTTGGITRGAKADCSDIPSVEI